MSDFFPLIVDGSGTPAIKEIPSGDVLDLTGVTVKAVSVDTTLAVTGNTTLGGTLGVTGVVTLASNLNMGDSDKINLGAGSDLQIFHDGSNSFINDTGTGDLSIKASNNLKLMSGASETYATFTADGAAAIYHDNSKRLETASGAVNILNGSASVFEFKIDPTPEIIINDSDDNNYAVIGYSDGAMNISSNNGDEAGGADTISLQTGGVTQVAVTNSTVTATNAVIASKSARITQVAITSSSNAVAWDSTAAANAYHVTTENTTFSAPSNSVEGAIISVELAQGGTVRTIAWNTVFEFAASTAPTATPSANKTDIFSFRYNGSVWQEIGRVQNLAQT